MSSKRTCQSRKTMRLPDFDYAGNATYFITICSWRRQPLFGSVVDREMVCNPYGEIATAEWMRSVDIRSELDLHHMVVMPNHLHGLVTITPVHPQSDQQQSNMFRRSPRSLGTFVGGYKSSVTRQINELRQTPGASVWQSNYYEHIVRNEATFKKIWDYIEHNPVRWADDGENPESSKFRQAP